MRKTTIIEILILLSGKSQKDFATMVNIPAPNLSEMKTGKRDIPLGKFISWCKLADVNPIDVFKEFYKTA